jgi:membrane protein
MAFLVILLGAVIGPVLWELGLPVLDDVPQWEWLWDGARTLVAGFVLFAVTAVLYRWLPDWRPAWRHILPGALAASIGWLVLAGLFSVFLDEVDDFTITYGSLGGILVTLLFLLFSAADFVLGAEFNAALRDRRQDGV